MNKPPLGIMPKYLWDDTRRKELEEAIERYIESDETIPVDWVNELNELRIRDDETQEPLITITLSEYERLKKYDVESIETKEGTVYGERYLRVADGFPDDITGKELKRLADDINCGSVLWVNGKGKPESYVTQENDYVDVEHIKDDYFLFTQKR